ncbi:MAG: leucine-rich repeat domain-containing protein [Candidatus Lokiarchaeota archaeon]|nr:leucine-rich repeat domain-containing protein [Candidatus Lokiarchaeota archaeon]
MKKYYSIPLEDEEAQALLDISRLMDDKPVMSVLFSDDIDSALEKVDFGATFWYHNNHVIGLSFLNSKFKHLPESIGNLSYLRFIFIEDGPFQDIPINFKKLHNLERLILINNPENEFFVNLDFPDIFGHLFNLKILVIYGLFNVYIPLSFLELKKLEELHFELCFFSSNRSKFMINYDVKDPYLVENPIHELPKEFGNLKMLKKIALIYLKKIKLPQSMVNLTSLIELDLNHSEELDNIEIVYNIKSLAKLNLSHCNVESLPETIKNLTNLKEFNLSHNNLNEIPSEIKYCQNLEKLFLNWNLFGESIEDWVSYIIQLPRLNHLRIEKGYYKYIPKELLNKKNFKLE